MKQRPIVWMCAGYIVFLFMVLMVRPEWGETIYQWEEKENAIKARYADRKEWQGQVVSLEEKKEKQYVKVQLEGGEHCIVLCSQKVDIQPGDHILVTGRARWPEAAHNPGEWDAKLYARMHRFFFYIEARQITLIKEEVRIERYLFQCKQYLLKAIDQQWQEPWNGMIQSILLGEKGELDEEMRDLMSQAGIAHIMAISGLHLTLISHILIRFLKRFQRPKTAQLEVLCLIWLYVGMTGAAVATVRAAVMMTIRAAAVLLNREEDELTTLALTAMILLLWQPLYLLDAGFCLSFAAILGIRYGRVWMMLFSFLPYRLRRYASSVLGVSFATIPVSLRFFYQASGWSFLLNLWVLPVMGALLPLILAALGLGAVHPALGNGVGALVQLLLWSFKKGSEYLSLLPGGMWRGAPAVYKLMIYYGLLIGVIYYFSRPVSKQRKSKGILLCGMLLAILLHKASFWRVSYLDVGQGDCAVVEWNSSVWIIDAGPQYEKVLKPYLLYRGVKKIEGVILSHPDWDHLEGLLALSEDSDFQIKGLWMAGEASHETELRGRLEQNVQKQSGIVRKVMAGYRLQQAADFSWQARSPEKEYEDVNRGSLVVQLQLGDMKFLFTGDIDCDLEAEQVSSWEQVQILKVAHHGSKTSSSADFLKRTRPQLAVISCDRQSSYGHPHKEVIKRLEEAGIPWLVTDDVGAIWIERKYGKIRFYYNQKE